jgi:hypothetical protein
MTILILYASALFLGLLIVVIVALVHAMITREHTQNDATQSAHLNARLPALSKQ